MGCDPRSKPPDRWQPDLSSALAAFDHLTSLGLVSEVVVHTLFARFGWCRCPRCLFDRTAGDK